MIGLIQCSCNEKQRKRQKRTKRKYFTKMSEEVDNTS